jgi:hypothetical protein
MEEWEIIPNPKDGTLDLLGLKRREFTEFFEKIKPLQCKRVCQFKNV